MAAITYADTITPSFGIPFPRDRLRMVQGELQCSLSPAQQEQLSDQEIEDLVTLINEQPEAMKQNPLDWMWTLESWEKCNKLWKEAKCQIIFGGNRCLVEDTRIDMPDKTLPIHLIRDGDIVCSWNYKEGKMVAAKVEGDAICKGELECVLVRLDGLLFDDITCSLNHRIMSHTGEWVAAKDLKSGDRLMGGASVMGVYPVGKYEVWDITVPETGNYLVDGVPHHNSTKTSYASALNLDIMRKIPEAKTFSLQTNEERSNLINQDYLHSVLPYDLRDIEKKKPKGSHLTWSQPNGFTNDMCVLPPQEGYEKGSSCHFKNYSQFHNNSQAFEGMKGHLIHFDEEIPYLLFETLFGRLGDYMGRIIGTVTTLQGYTPLVADLMKEAETLETRYAPLLGMELPTLQKCKLWPDTYIHYWWTQDNPFIPAQEILRSYENRPHDIKKARIYGIPTKSHSNQFPKFSREVNVIKHDEIPFIKDPSEEVSVYLGCDPGRGKPWVFSWIGFTPSGNVYIFKEFPDMVHGEWALPHQTSAGIPLGKKGPAQRPLGWGFQQWADCINDIESQLGHEALMRWMDPNFCKQTITKKEGEADLIAEMADVGMYFSPATYDGVDAGIAQINALLEYDNTKPLSESNRPDLYISDQCENHIQAFIEYTGCGKMEHWKDFIDPARYVIVSGSEYIGKDQYGISSRGGSY